MAAKCCMYHMYLLQLQFMDLLAWAMLIKDTLICRVELCLE